MEEKKKKYPSAHSLRKKKESFSELCFPTANKRQIAGTDADAQSRASASGVPH